MVEIIRAPFITKLYELVCNPSDINYIQWGPLGKTIVVTDSVKFAKEVLPRHFKSDNIQSFVRQLNMYGFQRCRNMPISLNSVSEMEFVHDKFVKGRPDLLRQITRGMATTQKKRAHASMMSEGHFVPAEAERSTPSSALALASELSGVQSAIYDLDLVLKASVVTAQSKLGSLVDALNAVNQARVATSSTSFPMHSGQHQPFAHQHHQQLYARPQYFQAPHHNVASCMLPQHSSISHGDFGGLPTGVVADDQMGSAYVEVDPPVVIHEVTSVPAAPIA